MSHIGQQLVAPNGWGTLVKDRTYHFLGFLEGNSHARLAFFSSSPERVHFDLVPRRDFEAGLKHGGISPVSSEKTRRLPPWLAALHYRAWPGPNSNTVVDVVVSACVVVVPSDVPAAHPATVTRTATSVAMRLNTVPNFD